MILSKKSQFYVSTVVQYSTSSSCPNTVLVYPSIRFKARRLEASESTTEREKRRERGGY